jgi:hypothetical protein
MDHGLPDDVQTMVASTLGLGGLLAVRAAARDPREWAHRQALTLLARALHRAFGLAEAALAAQWMSEDVAPGAADGVVAYGVWLRAASGHYAGTPLPGTLARYLDQLSTGVRPDFRPDCRDACIWDCHPYDPETSRSERRLLVVAGRHGSGKTEMVETILRHGRARGVRCVWGLARAAERGDLVVVDARHYTGLVMLQVENELADAARRGVDLILLVYELNDVWPSIMARATSVVIKDCLDARVVDGRLVRGCDGVGGVHYRPGRDVVRRIDASNRIKFY